MVMRAYKRALAVLMRKPFVLWGLSLMSGLLTILISASCALLPIVSVPVTLTLSAGMALIYLDGLRGKSVNSDQLFAGFKKFAHVAGGMAWMELWVFIWSMIPIVGPIIGIVKAYSYAFTPYILMTRPGVSATEALRISMRETYGKKGSMFLADLLFAVAVFVIVLVLALIGIIPILGTLILFLGVLILVAFSPLVKGLVSAFFYETRHAQPPVYNNAPYPNGGAPHYPQYPNQPAQPGYTAQPGHAAQPQYGAPQRPVHPNQGMPMNAAPQRPVPPQQPAAPQPVPQQPAEQPTPEQEQ